jgi:hypothetical protein
VTGGRVRCWGSVRSDDSNATTFASQPVDIPAFAGATAIAAGEGFACAILKGALACRGRQWPDSSATSAQLSDMTWAPSDVGAVRALASSGHDACAITQTGAAACWSAAEPATTVIGAGGATAVAVGYHHACAVRTDGGVSCWGDGRMGQTGDPGLGAATMRVSSPGFALAGLESTVAGVEGAVAIAAGGYHTCVIVGGGHVDCWGYNPFGQLGAPGDPNGTGAYHPQVVEVPGIAGAAAITAGAMHTCAVVSGGVLCWGFNSDGELGGPGPNTYMPTAVPGIAGATAIAAGIAHTCALSSDGHVRCWGYDNAGQLGNGVIGGQSQATPVINL